jgi:hypothetical protein
MWSLTSGAHHEHIERTKDTTMLHPDLTAQISRQRHAERLAAAERHHRLFREPITVRPARTAIVTDLLIKTAHVDRVA